MNAINAFRAQICATMHEEHGQKFASFEACEDFMHKTCHPGKDMKMDGDTKEVTSGQGYCTEYFPEAEKKAEEQIAAEDRKAEEERKAVEKASADAASEEDAAAPEQKATGTSAESVGAAPAPSSAGAPGNADGTKGSDAAAASNAGGEKADAGSGDAATKGGGKKDGASAGSVVGSPAAAGAPASAPGGAPGGYPPHEAWYYKNGGKDLKSRLHMDSSKGLPAHGYWGELVRHQDMESTMDDWGKEFGGGSYSNQWKKLCAKHPDSPWCDTRHPHKSSASRCCFLAASLVFASLLAGLC
jgi:hypothetical protein